MAESRRLPCGYWAQESYIFWQIFLNFISFCTEKNKMHTATMLTAQCTGKESICIRNSRRQTHWHLFIFYFFIG